MPCFFYLILLPLLLLGSCTVYAPMQPVAPLVRRAGQAECLVSVQAIGRAEATVVYAPRPGLLVLGGLTAAPRLGQEQFLVTGQYEAGVGFYQPLGPYWVLSGLGGFGQAYCHRGSLDLGNSYSEYEARYAKLFGQIGVVGEFDRHSTGLAYRLIQVNFSQLDQLARQAQAVPLAGMLRHELDLTNRRLLDGERRWQLITTIGLSVASAPDNGSGSGNYGVTRTLLPAFLYSLGLGYRLGPVVPAGR